MSNVANAILDNLTRIPLGRGSATITWTGSTGVTPTIDSITGSAHGYKVIGQGRVPETPSAAGTPSSIPSQFPIADVTGTIGGTRFTLQITLSLPGSPSSSLLQNFGHVTGTFRDQPVQATLTANVKSRSFGFHGTIGTLHVTGVVEQPVQHGRMETAHASFEVSK